METLKNIVGAGSKKEELSGQEPVSGVEGKGTAGEPFDAGNEQGNENLSGKAPQQTSSSVGASGQEPISGVKGAGTADKPFDSGNLDDKADLAGKAPQRTDNEPEYQASQPTTTGAERAIETSGSDPATDNSVPKLTKKPTIGSPRWFTGTAEEKSASPPSAEVSEDSPKPQLEKKPTIGSSRWFTNVNPFAKTEPQEDATEGSQQPNSSPAPRDTAAEVVEREEISSMPPNHLGKDVPPGQDTIVMEPTIDPAFRASGNMPNHLGDDVPPGQANGGLSDKGKGKAKISAEQAEQLENRQDFPSHKTESSSLSTRRESVSTQYTIGTRQTYSTNATGTSIAGSSRRASAAVHIVTSQGKPITAGGVPLGLPAMEERERRLSFSVPEDPEQEFYATKNASVGFDGPKHHDFANGAPQPTAQGRKPSATGRDQVPSKTDGAESKPAGDKLRRRSSIIHKAKDFGRRMRQSISK